MPYDPQGNGASPDDLLVRRGAAWESARRLAGKAAQAEVAGSATNGTAFGHGVSMTSSQANQRLARDPQDAARVTRKTLEEAGFTVRYTPTRNDSDHHTVELPKPLTDEAAELFNQVLGRIR